MTNVFEQDERASNAEAIQKRAPGKKRFSWTTLLSGSAVLLSGLALTVSLMGNIGPRPLNWQETAQLLPNHTGQSTFQLADRSTPGDRRLFSNSANLIADVAEDIAPSVVNIDVQREGKTMAVSPFTDEFLQRFFGFQPMPFRQIPQQAPVIRGNGSGVIINADGYVLTNNHVVQGADDIVVTTNDGKKYKAQVVGRDPFSDIAVVKMENAHNLKAAVLGSSKNLRPGEWVIAVGSPLGFDHTVTLGIVSALSRQVPDINANVEFIQTDAAINPGNSGGPLVNLSGEVIGINTAIAGSGQNIGFAIPVDVAKKVSESLISNGHVTRPWIGISMAELKPDLAKSLGIPENIHGVIVAQVLPNSPSFRAGFQQGDIIQRINGTTVSNPKEIQELIRNKPINSEINIQILRNGQMSALTLRTEPLPDTAANSGRTE